MLMVLPKYFNGAFEDAQEIVFNAVNKSYQERPVCATFWPTK
jgi:hypothetical protein